MVINSINPFNWIKVGRRIEKERPDVIVVRYWLPFMGPCFGTILRQAKKNKHSKVVCIADNVIPHEKRAGDTAFTKYFIKPVDAFITMSEKVLADLKIFDVGLDRLATRLATLGGRDDANGMKLATAVTIVLVASSVPIA